MFRYETHLHTSPVSRCASAGMGESLEFYKKLGYDGVFITNHFIDGNMNREGLSSYEEKIKYYFSAIEEGAKIGKEVGIKVFSGVETSYKGADFLIYGLNKEWFLAHPEIASMDRYELLKLYAEEGALVIHAHPFRDIGFHEIRLFPKGVHGVEVINACRSDSENEMARLYAKNYGLIEFAGSDNHHAGKLKMLAGMCCDNPILDEQDFVRRVKNREMNTFVINRDE